MPSRTRHLPRPTFNRYQDAALAAFEDHLRQIIQRAQDATVAYVVRQMEIEDGAFTASLRNSQVARRLDDVFMAEMDKAGYLWLKECICWFVPRAVADHPGIAGASGGSSESFPA